MRVVVVEPPAPIVMPSDVPGGHSGDDALVTLMIAAAQADIDGPTGWLGRCLGVQTLEWTGDCWPAEGRLPYPPLIEILAVSYQDAAGVVQVLPVDALVDQNGSAQGIKIRYRAGYAEPPANAKAAVILMAMGLASTTEANGGLRGFTVEGAFSRQFNSPELVARVRTQAVENLLHPLRVFT